MIATKARELFHGPERYNCAQAVAAALHANNSQKEHILAEYASYGGGRAEDGLCGALFAALQLLPEAEKREQLQNRFAKIATETHCRAIRKRNKISCAECVEHAARLAHEILDS